MKIIPQEDLSKKLLQFENFSLKHHTFKNGSQMKILYSEVVMKQLVVFRSYKKNLKPYLEGVEIWKY